VIAVNLKGSFLVGQAVARVMVAAGPGSIVNMSSLVGSMGQQMATIYCATKGGITAFTKALARETADTEVLVNAVTPSVADTDILSQFTPDTVKWMVEQVPKGRFVKASEIAALVAWLCSEDCSFSTGQLFDISGGRSVY
jgi:3-oxoacyl-[acyl-carrier protein] reductase